MALRGIAAAALALLQGYALAAEPGGPLTAGSVVQVVGGLLVVLAAFALTAMGLKRWSGVRTAQGNRLRVVEGLAIGTRDRLVLVQVGRDQVLLGLSPGRIQPLHVLHAVEAPAATPEFAAELERSAGTASAGGGMQ